jgi:sporulation protein YlmC with PRC-barrel domain
MTEMKMKRLSVATAALIAASLITPAMAQTAGAPVVVMASAPAGKTVQKYYKQNVYDPAKSKIGTIDDVVISDDGQIEALIVGVGGFLGAGEKNVAVPYRSIHAEMKDGAWYLTLNTTKDALKAAPGVTFDKTKTAWVPAPK